MAGTENESRAIGAEVEEVARLEKRVKRLEGKLTEALKRIEELEAKAKGKNVTFSGGPAKTIFTKAE